MTAEFRFTTRMVIRAGLSEHHAAAVLEPGRSGNPGLLEFRFTASRLAKFQPESHHDNLSTAIVHQVQPGGMSEL